MIRTTHSSVPAPRRPSDGQREPSRESERVVVAVDGSAASVRALSWAMRHAKERGQRVEVLTVWPLRGSVFVREVAGHFCQPRWDAREAQAAAAAKALATIEEAPRYELRIENASLVDALARIAHNVAMVVVGSDRDATSGGRGGLAERIRNAVSTRLVVVGPEGPREP